MNCAEWLTEAKERVTSNIVIINKLDISQEAREILIMNEESLRDYIMRAGIANRDFMNALSSSIREQTK